MSEIKKAPKYVGLLLAAGIGGSALTSCASDSSQTWEIGVTCPAGAEVQVGSLDDDVYAYSQNNSRIGVLCLDASGVNTGITSMELTKGQGAIINTNKTYTNMVEIKYDDQFDGYDPEISMDTQSGYVKTDNVKVLSVAVTE